jgi:hypothetical protein
MDEIQRFIDQNMNELSKVYKNILDRNGSHRDIKNICNATKIQFMLRHIIDSTASIQISDIHKAVDTI